MNKTNRPRRLRGEMQFQKQIQERTRRSLLQKDADFAKLHKNDSDERLLDYVRIFARRLGRSFHAGEIIGGPYIAARFQGWDKVIAAAELPLPPAMPDLENRLIYKEEYKRQERLLRQERNAGKDARKEQNRRKDAEGREEDLARKERDLAWGREHEQDTDAQLTAYIKARACELGHSPAAREIPGAAYIAGRFGSWAVALSVAGLPLPEGMKPPNPKTLKAYRDRIRAAAPPKPEQQRQAEAPLRSMISQAANAASGSQGLAHGTPGT